MSFNSRGDRGDAEDDCSPLFLPGCRESACWPPADGLGRRSRPRPAKRRWLSCRLIEGITSSIDNSYHERSSAARLTWPYLLPGPSSHWIFFTKAHPRIKGKASKIVPRGRGFRGACTASSAPRYPSALNRAGPRRRG